MTKNGYIGKAKLKVGLMRDGYRLESGSEQECTQLELDGGYFDKATFKATENGQKMMASPDNKSMSSPETKAVLKKRRKAGGIDK